MPGGQLKAPWRSRITSRLVPPAAASLPPSSQDMQQGPGEQQREGEGGGGGDKQASGAAASASATDSVVDLSQEAAAAHEGAAVGGKGGAGVTPDDRAVRRRAIEQVSSGLLRLPCLPCLPCLLCLACCLACLPRRPCCPEAHIQVPHTSCRPVPAPLKPAVATDAADGGPQPPAAGAEPVSGQAGGKRSRGQGQQRRLQWRLLSSQPGNNLGGSGGTSLAGAAAAFDCEQFEQSGRPVGAGLQGSSATACPVVCTCCCNGLKMRHVLLEWPATTQNLIELVPAVSGLIGQNVG